MPPPLTDMSAKNVIFFKAPLREDAQINECFVLVVPWYWFIFFPFHDFFIFIYWLWGFNLPLLVDQNKKKIFRVFPYGNWITNKSKKQAFHFQSNKSSCLRFLRSFLRQNREQTEDYHKINITFHSSPQ